MFIHPKCDRKCQRWEDEGMSVVTDNAVSAKKAAKFKFVFITTFGSFFFSEEKSGNGKKAQWTISQDIAASTYKSWRKKR